jgi:hypothetical protein
VLCVFANLEASQFLPWKREALENCFWDAICNRVSAKYVGTMKCRFPLFFSPVGSELNSEVKKILTRNFEVPAFDLLSISSS